jgi:hypothetical protein
MNIPAEAPDYLMALRQNTFSFVCPRCGHEMKETFGRFYDNNNTVCSYSLCNETITFDAEQFRSGLRQLADGMTRIWLTLRDTA